MRKPRKKKVQTIGHIWDWDNNQLYESINYLKENFPTSGTLVRYEAERERREKGLPVPTIGND